MLQNIMNCQRQRPFLDSTGHIVLSGVSFTGGMFFIDNTNFVSPTPTPTPTPTDELGSMFRSFSSLFFSERRGRTRKRERERENKKYTDKREKQDTCINTGIVPSHTIPYHSSHSTHNTYTILRTQYPYK